jgi:2-(1,2-epoxy-1,2-dihydrophenyl)acetyl-CoA isomerase
MMLGDKVSAAEALHMGMLYKVFEDEIFETESKKIALQLAQMPTKALGYIKQALNASATNDITTQLALEDGLQQKAAATADFKEGVDAFLAKRAPQYKGQ